MQTRPPHIISYTLGLCVHVWFGSRVTAKLTVMQNRFVCAGFDTRVPPCSEHLIGVLGALLHANPTPTHHLIYTGVVCACLVWLQGHCQAHSDAESFCVCRL